MMKKNTKETDEATKRDLAEGKKNVKRNENLLTFFPFLWGAKWVKL